MTRISRATMLSFACIPSPYTLVSRRHAHRTPYEAVYADISISPAAFVAPYGVSGLSVACSVMAGASIGPVTAFVEANASALTPALRAPSSSPCGRLARSCGR